MAKKNGKPKANGFPNGDKLVCAYCGKVKEEIIFCIGASKEPDWTMVEGTGKITCPECYNKAMAEGKKAIDACITAYNGSGKKTRKIDNGESVENVREEEMNGELEPNSVEDAIRINNAIKRQIEHDNT